MGAIFSFLFGCVVGIIAGAFLVTWYMADCDNEDYESLCKKFHELRIEFQERKKNNEE